MKLVRNTTADTDISIHIVPGTMKLVRDTTADTDISILTSGLRPGGFDTAGDWGRELCLHH